MDPYFEYNKEGFHGQTIHILVSFFTSLHKLTNDAHLEYLCHMLVQIDYFIHFKNSLGSI